MRIEQYLIGKKLKDTVDLGKILISGSKGRKGLGKREQKGRTKLISSNEWEKVANRIKELQSKRRSGIGSLGNRWGG